MSSHQRKDRWRLDSLIKSERADAFLAANAIPPPEQRESDETLVVLTKELLSALSPAQLEAVELVVMNQVSMREGARMLGINSEAMRKRVARAMEKMRQRAETLGSITPDQ